MSNDEWCTPPDILDRVKLAFGGSIDLDPASTARANIKVQAAQFFTREDDGLMQRWEGDVFLNPPYSQPLCSRFVAKFIAEHEAGRIQGILLVNASTDTSWYHALAQRFSVCLTKGRISFLRDGEPVKGNRVGQAIFFTCRHFATNFRSLGIIYPKAT